MSFWIRHTVLLLLCVLVPFTAALYQDTESRVERAKESSRRSLHLAVRSLPLILQNEAHRSVSAAMSTAQRAVIDNRYSALRRGGTKGAAAAQESPAAAERRHAAQGLRVVGRRGWSDHSRQRPDGGRRTAPGRPGAPGVHRDPARLRPRRHLERTRKRYIRLPARPWWTATRSSARCSSGARSTSRFSGSGPRRSAARSPWLRPTSR